MSDDFSPVPPEPLPINKVFKLPNHFHSLAPRPLQDSAIDEESNGDGVEAHKLRK